MLTRIARYASVAAASAAVSMCAPLAFSFGAASAQGAGVQNAPADSKHFDPNGKPPSTYTLELRKGLVATLPFADKRDFDEAKKGFIAEPPYTQIMADAGNVAWDMGSYQWLLQDKDFPSIHPSLQRQAVLNMAYGLYEVVPGRIYQVRGFDLANISFIKGDTGWIVFDPLTAKETARAALELINEKLGKRPVVGVVYSHSHGDHFGGVRGVVDEADVASGKVMVIAPEGFMRAAIEENVFAGNAMSRRLQWQYAVLLPRGPFGHVDQAIGKNIANGSTGLIAPNRIIAKDFEEITLDGVRMVFQNTPDTEAPVEMNTWFPQFKAFWAAENVTGTMHNIYTLRGAAVRNALNWSKQINVALWKFGQQAEVMFSSHTWPRWGNDRIQEVMRAQRDAYANLNNQSLHYANQGVTINEIQNVYEVPKSLQQQWATRSYHGDVKNNSRAVINRYLGFYDGNPVNLHPLSPQDSAPLYVEMMGGSAKIMAKGQQLVGQGKYLEATEILNKLVFAEPRNAAGSPPARRRLRAARLPGREHERAQQLPAGRLRAAQRPAGRCPAALDRTGRGPRDVHRYVARLPRHQHGPEAGRGDALHHQPGDSRQRREVPRGVEQCHADQHRRRAGEESRPGHHGQPGRPQPGDDGGRFVRRPGQGRQGDHRRGQQDPRSALCTDGPVHAEFRDPAGNGAAGDRQRCQGVRQPCIGAGRVRGMIAALGTRWRGPVLRRLEPLPFHEIMRPAFGSLARAEMASGGHGARRMKSSHAFSLIVALGAGAAAPLASAIEPIPQTPGWRGFVVGGAGYTDVKSNLVAGNGVHRHRSRDDQFHLRCTAK